MNPYNLNLNYDGMSRPKQKITLRVSRFQTNPPCGIFENPSDYRNPFSSEKRYLSTLFFKCLRVRGEGVADPFPERSIYPLS